MKIQSAISQPAGFPARQPPARPAAMPRCRRPGALAAMLSGCSAASYPKLAWAAWPAAWLSGSASRTLGPPSILVGWPPALASRPPGPAARTHGRPAAPSGKYLLPDRARRPNTPVWERDPNTRSKIHEFPLKWDSTMSGQALPLPSSQTLMCNSRVDFRIRLFKGAMKSESDHCVKSHQKIGNRVKHNETKRTSVIATRSNVKMSFVLSTNHRISNLSQSDR